MKDELSNEQYETIIDKHGYAVHENKKLTKINKALKKENGHLRRIIRSLKEDLKLVQGKRDKAHYKNGKRGSRLNG